MSTVQLSKPTQLVAKSIKKKRKNKTSELIAMIVLILISGYLVIPPLLLMIWSSFTPGGKLDLFGSLSLSAYAAILTSSRFWEMAQNTFIFSVGSSVGGIGIGTILAWLVARTNTPGKQLVYATAFIGFAVPGMLKLIGWIFLLGPNNGAINLLLKNIFGSWAVLNIQSMGGMIFVESLFWTPMVFFLMVGPMQSMDPNLEESAAVSGANPWMTMRRISVRLLLPSILSVCILMFIRSIQSFEIPLFLGAPGGVMVLTSSIFLDLKESFIPDYAQASAYGTLLISFLFMILLLYHWVTQRSNRFQTVTGKGFRPRLVKVGKWRWLGSLFIVLIFLCMIFPVLSVFYASFLPHLGSSGGWATLSMINYKEMMQYSSVFKSIYNSMFVAIVTASSAVLLAAVASWLLVRTRIRGRWIIDLLISVPLVFPGIILSLAVLLFYLYIPFPPLYSTIWIIIVAYIAHFTPYALRYTQPALLQIHSDLEESAKISGAHWLRVFRKILMPLLMPALIGSWIFIFFHSIRELSIASLLYTGHTPVVATQILDMWTNGNLNVLSAFGTIITFLSIVVAGIIYFYAKRFGIKI